MITIQLPIPESTLSQLLNSPKKSEQGLIVYIQEILSKHIEREVEVALPDQDELLEKALKMASQLEEGTEFIFHTMFESNWSLVSQPRVFGRNFRKSAEEKGIAQHIGKTSDNKAIYRRTAKKTK